MASPPPACGRGTRRYDLTSAQGCVAGIQNQLSNLIGNRVSAIPCKNIRCFSPCYVCHKQNQHPIYRYLSHPTCSPSLFGQLGSKMGVNTFSERSWENLRNSADKTQTVQFCTGSCPLDNECAAHHIWTDP